MAVADFVKETKRVSSRWIKERGDSLGEFQWQTGYAALSVSPAHADTVAQYIEKQDTHHRQIGFQDEYRALLRENETEFDERYVWD